MPPRKPFLTNIVRSALQSIIKLIKSNIQSADYPWTKFPNDEPSRKPFITVEDDWRIEGNKITASWWWNIHRLGGTFYPKPPRKIFSIPYKGKMYFVRRMHFPQRDPVPTQEQIEDVIARSVRRKRGRKQS